ncbi:hypothetical protein B4135_1167 [Caldibacillus debilis]|jgi:hypothetical protein|uniref:Uncharacterized protein n=1 Tax=Caldibacillus debilis TaxID=301148 RepID=A0A150MDP1_9BACI|nr:hypothetical protein B4135_1167 [Caldibacillus debilis]
MNAIESAICLREYEPAGPGPALKRGRVDTASFPRTALEMNSAYGKNVLLTKTG